MRPVIFRLGEMYCQTEQQKGGNDMTELPHRHDSGENRLGECLSRAESFQTVAELFRQLSDSSRIRIFWLLCHAEECVLNISALMDMSSPAVSHHLRQLKASGLIVARRAGREVCYRAADSEQAALLHEVIEQTMKIACPKEDAAAVAAVPECIDPDAGKGEPPARYPQGQIDTIHRIHKYLTEDLSRRVTIEELSRKFLINPSTMKEVFREVYGSSIAAHVREHRMGRAAALLKGSDMSIAEVASAVGYGSHSKFTAEFRRAYGMPPTEYRRLAK